MNPLFAPPLLDAATYSGVLRRETGDRALRAEARRRMWAALRASNVPTVAAAFGYHPRGLRKLLQADVWPEVDGQPPLAEYKGVPGNPALRRAGEARRAEPPKPRGKPGRPRKGEEVRK